MKALFFTIASSLLSTIASAQSVAIQDCCPKVEKKHSNSKMNCHAAMPEACCPRAGNWCGITYDLYGNWVFLQPNGSNLYYAAQAIGLDPDIAVPAVSPNWKIKEIDPDYHSGFEVGAGVLFRNTNISIQANWERLHAHDRKSFKTPSGAGNMVGPFFNIGPNSAAYQTAKGRLESHFDGVNLDFGKKVCFFNRLYMNFGGGVGFTRIKQTVQSLYTNSAGTISRFVKTESKFTGAGPQLMVEYDYRMFSDFFFTGSTDITLFMGQLKNGTTYKSTTPELATLGVTQPNVQKTTVPDRAQLVPGFEQKLGISYVANCKRARINFEVGYQCQIYLNAIQSVDMTAPQVLPAGATFSPDVGVFAVGFERTLGNYILTGPYASLGIAF